MANSSLPSSTEAVDKLQDVAAPPPTPSLSSFFDDWERRIFYPKLLGGVSLVNSSLISLIFKFSEFQMLDFNTQIVGLEIDELNILNIDDVKKG